MELAALVAEVRVRIAGVAAPVPLGVRARERVPERVVPAAESRLAHPPRDLPHVGEDEPGLAPETRAAEPHHERGIDLGQRAGLPHRLLRQHVHRHRWMRDRLLASRWSARQRPGLDGAGLDGPGLDGRGSGRQRAEAQRPGDGRASLVRQGGGDLHLVLRAR